MSRYRPTLEHLETRLAPATLPPGFTETPIASGLANPTAFDLAPDGRIFITEQGGTVRIFRDGTLLPTPFLSLNVDSAGERGLLGIAFDPNFAANHFVYVYYTVPAAPEHNRVSRFTANGDVAVPGSEVVLLDLNPLSTATNHNGGAIHFGTDGKLYIGVGENANGANSQSLDTLLGKMLRINPDGSIPGDNPFFTTASGVNRAIWALGLRNPFTFAVQPGTGRVFINDVGQNTFEEIDEGVAGANYGWPDAEGPSDNPAFRNPIFFYGHGPGNTLGIAITGGTFYNPPTAQFPADYVGEYFFADLGNNWIRRFNPSDGSATLFASDVTPGTVDLKVNSSGSLLYLSRGTGSNTGVLTEVDNTTAEQRFVQALYKDLLGRHGTAAEWQLWVPLLPTLGRAGVVNGILRSHEALVRQVDGYYQYFLNRGPDPSGEAFWVSQLEQGGATAEQVMAGFLSSAEFARRADALEGTGDTDANFVRSLYRLLLGRTDTAVSAGEVNAWLGLLPSAGRASVATDLLSSIEFRGDVVQALYGAAGPAAVLVPNLLTRPTPPTAAEVQGWVAAPLDLLGLETDIAASVEYFNNA
jgi:glucose/arabinose dehydrogenase